MLYEPVKPSEKAQIDIFIMHAELDYLRSPGCIELSKRGYTVLCANTTIAKKGTSLDFRLDQILMNARPGVAYHRELPNIEKIILWGHSSCGALMAA